MGNLDFTNQPGFSWYCILLLVSGVALLVLGPVPGLSRGSRIANLLFGLGFLGYGIYLVFVFHGGTYFLLFKAFIVPVVLIVNAVRELRYANLRRRGNSRLKGREKAMAGEVARRQAEIQTALAEAHAQHDAAQAQVPTEAQ